MARWCAGKDNQKVGGLYLWRSDHIKSPGTVSIVLLLACISILILAQIGSNERDQLSLYSQETPFEAAGTCAYQGGHASMPSFGNIPGNIYRRSDTAYARINMQVNAYLVVPPSLVYNIAHRYFHRSMNIPKLVEIGFTHVPRSMTLARMISTNKLPTETALAGLREMVDADVPAVQSLWTAYTKRFKLVPEFTADEFRHNLISGRGIGDVVDGRREKQVVWSFVVEVTGFFLHRNKHRNLTPSLRS